MAESEQRFADSRVLRFPVKSEIYVARCGRDANANADRNGDADANTGWFRIDRCVSG